MADTVLVLGGGIGGLTAAHELADRGYSVTVLERGTIPGGKARSMAAIGTERDGRPGLPAEHGFRFFPGFYKHVPDTMKRIPFGTNPNGVFDNLVACDRAEFAREGHKALVLPARFPESMDDLHLMFEDMFHNDLDISLGDKAHFLALIVRLLGSCDERRYLEYEQQSWWQFSESASRSKAFQQYLGGGLTRTLVAARAEEISARTGGTILLQLLMDMTERGLAVDRVLTGPTNLMWIEPWLSHLQSLGVDYREGAEVKAIVLDGKRVAGVDVEINGAVSRLTADWVVAAVPVEIMTTLVTAQMKEVEPRLAHLDTMVTRWMNGVMFYLRTDVPVVSGHVAYLDSKWALTSISQKQFWNNVDLSGYGDGTVRGILSVDVSDWTTQGDFNGKPAMECSREEVAAEVWAQLKAHLNVGTTLLDDNDVVCSYVDPDIREPNPHAEINLEPLLVNTAGSWAARPDAVTAIENLVLASDYVRTYTDLATMEGANEAARRAVNGILNASGSSEPRCGVYPLEEPAIFKPIKALDRFRFHHQHGKSSRPVGPGPGT